MIDPQASDYPSRLIAAEITCACTCDLFPGASLAGSYVTDVDFFCDLFLEQSVDSQAIPILEEAIRGYVKTAHPVRIVSMMRQNAAAYLEHLKQPDVAERIKNAPENVVPILEMGGYRNYFPEGDEITPPETTREVGVIKILSITRENEITRIHGIVSSNPQQLKKLYKKFEHAKNVDHRTLGPQMRLFSSSDALVENSFVWHPKGEFLRQMVIGLCWQHLLKAGFKSVKTPAKARTQAHTYLFTHESPVGRKIPIRYAEITEEIAGDEVPIRQGVFTASNYTADQWTLFCAPENEELELISSLQFLDKIIKIFAIEYNWVVLAKSTHDAIQSIEKALNKCCIDYVIDPRGAETDGPQVAIRMYDARGQGWTGPWLRLQGLLHDGQATVVLSGALIGSVEHLIAVLLEKCEGHLPLWIAPEQVRVIAIGSKPMVWAQAVQADLQKEGFRVGIDLSGEKLGSKVHAAESEKIPYLVILGDKEEREGSITVRAGYKEERQRQMKLGEFVEQLRREIWDGAPENEEY